jgi:hypothetical protein
LPSHLCIPCYIFRDGLACGAKCGSG